MLLKTILSLVTLEKRKKAIIAKMIATPNEINTIFQEEGPNLRTGERPKATPNMAKTIMVLIQRIFVITSCKVIINRDKKKTIIGIITKIATNGAAPGIINFPNTGAIKN